MKPIKEKLQHSDQADIMLSKNALASYKNECRKCQWYYLSPANSRIISKAYATNLNEAEKDKSDALNYSVITRKGRKEVIS